MIRVGMDPRDPRIEVNQHFPCKAEEYHVAFAGFMVRVGFAGSSRGAVQVDGPRPQDDGDHDSGQEFTAQEKTARRATILFFALQF